MKNEKIGELSVKSKKENEVRRKVKQDRVREKENSYFRLPLGSIYCPRSDFPMSFLFQSIPDASSTSLSCSIPPFPSKSDPPALTLGYPDFHSFQFKMFFTFFFGIGFDDLERKKAVTHVPIIFAILNWLITYVLLVLYLPPPWICCCCTAESSYFCIWSEFLYLIIPLPLKFFFPLKVTYPHAIA